MSLAIVSHNPIGLPSCLFYFFEFFVIRYNVINTALTTETNKIKAGLYQKDVYWTIMSVSKITHLHITEES